MVVIGDGTGVLCAGGVHKVGKRPIRHKVTICAETFSLVAGRCVFGKAARLIGAI